MNRRMIGSALLAGCILITGALPLLAQEGAEGRGQGGRRGGGRGGMRGGARSSLRLLSLPEVQQELKLDAAQIDLLRTLETDRPQRGGERGSATPEERAQRAARRQEQEKQVAQILDPKQLARLKQLQLQQSGIRAVGRKEVADALKFTPAQRQAIQAAMQAERETMRQAFEGFRGNTQVDPEQRRQAFQKMRELRTTTDAKVSAVLTDAQKKQLQSMQGAPFQFPQRRGFRGGGRPGGGRRRANPSNTL